MSYDRNKIYVINLFFLLFISSCYLSFNINIKIIYLRYETDYKRNQTKQSK